MSVFRVEKTKGYTVMSNHHLRNHALSLKAKGLLSQMLSLPDDWDYTLQGLAQINKESIDAIREAVVQAKAIRRPVCIVCNTVKGKGFVPAENERRVHNMPLTHEDYLASCAYIDQTC